MHNERLPIIFSAIPKQVPQIAIPRKFVHDFIPNTVWGMQQEKHTSLV